MALQLRDHDGSGGMNPSKGLSLREIADSTKRESAPPARPCMASAKLPAQRRPFEVVGLNRKKSMRALDRLLSFSLLTTDQWDDRKHLRGILILAMTICLVAAPFDWINWAKGTVPLAFPVGLTAGALLLFFAVPRKWELITLSIGLTFILSILGTILGRVPAGAGLEIVLITGALYFACTYIGERHKRREIK